MELLEYAIKDIAMNNTDALNYIIKYQNNLKIIQKTMISINKTYYRTPKNTKSYINRSLISKTRYALKNPYDNINRILFLFKKTLNVPNPELLALFNNVKKDFEYYIDIIMRISMTCEYALKTKNKSVLDQQEISLNSIFVKTFYWYNSLVDKILTISDLNLINEFNDVDLEWIKNEVIQNYYRHMITTEKQIISLVESYPHLKPYFSDIIRLCDTSPIINNLTVINTKTNKVLLESKDYKGMFPISSKLPDKIMHYPLLRVNVTFNQKPKSFVIYTHIIIQTNDSQINLKPKTLVDMEYGSNQLK